jgi:Centromere DNA-binding protein complex CBF3 subunit, domain 2/Transcriptional activator of glycolytic enzymes
MRVVAGHPTITQAYFLKRGATQPPDSLTSLVWPWADQALAMYRARQIENPDMTGKFFCEMLKSLRIVLLQDAAILSPLFPDFGLWNHPVFQHPGWTVFAEEVLRHEGAQDDPLDVRIQNVLPLVSERMAAIQSSMINTVREESSSVRLKFDGLQSKLCGLQSNLNSSLGTVNQRLDGLDGTMKAILRNQGQPIGNFMLVPATGGQTPTFQGPCATSSHDTGTRSLATTLQVNDIQRSKRNGDSSDQVAQPSPNHASDLLRLSLNRQSRPAACPEGCPAEPIAASMRSMHHVYQEWYSGLEGPGGEKQMSIVQLEARFGKAWRYNGSLRTRCSDRKLLVQTMEEESRRTGRSIEVVIQLCDAIQSDGNRISPDKFKRELRRGKSLGAILGE